ncbi:2802_t:CDS:2 [Paraglomus occultum]|uniref:2802_t:CDS:1 n=1 Tax=Paraglomus occultum TaxID=144539 RepID=A0A9N8Z814_9GLOM|nr:2802_t:CDS:2 [Paraglomus occultum]
MTDEDPFDIYGDDTFLGTDETHDDLYDENPGDEDGTRPAKRRREGNNVGTSDRPDDLEINEDDLFADFGEVEKEMGGIVNSAKSCYFEKELSDGSGH